MCMLFRKHDVNMKENVVIMRLSIKRAKIKEIQAESEKKNIDVLG